jgi:hypothetical protein
MKGIADPRTGRPCDRSARSGVRIRGVTSFSCYAKNPFLWFAPAIKIAVDVSSDGSLIVSGTAYRSVEVWRYDGEQGIATNLADYDARTSFWNTSGLLLGADYLTR